MASFDKDFSKMKINMAFPEIYLAFGLIAATNESVEIMDHGDCGTEQIINVSTNYARNSI
jgi:hypothetical protein